MIPGRARLNKTVRSSSKYRRDRVRRRKDRPRSTFSDRRGAIFYAVPRTGVAAKPVAKAEIESSRSKAADAGKSEPYLKDIAYRLRSFAKVFNGMSENSPQEGSDFVKDLKLSPGSFNHAPLLRTFFPFCQARLSLARDSGMFGDVEHRRDSSRDIKINGKIARYSPQ
jgi:hypothetical protein